VAKGLWQPAPGERQAELYLKMISELESRGFAAYELSNFAQPGRESRHNQRYWTRDPYLGLGPSAHSFDGRQRWWKLREARPWCEALEGGGDGVAESEHLDHRAIRRERILLGLRREEGVPEAWLADRLTLVGEFQRAGWLHRAGGQIAATHEGWLLLDEMLPRLCE
jgi:coproporphyrinogen III oxidase-like Fe-S oxidoreductase